VDGSQCAIWTTPEPDVTAQSPVRVVTAVHHGQSMWKDSTITVKARLPTYADSPAMLQPCLRGLDSKISRDDLA